MRISDWSSDVCSSDLFANSRVGLGVQVSGINQNFVVGSIKGTGNQFDMAIDGANGMFRVQDTSGNILYTRNGQFHADKDNYIVNAQGQRLTGYDATGTNIVPIKVPTGNISPKPTGSVDFTTNLDANSPVIRSEEHTSELQSLIRNSYAAF